MHRFWSFRFFAYLKKVWRYDRISQEIRIYLKNAKHDDTKTKNPEGGAAIPLRGFRFFAVTLQSLGWRQTATLLEKFLAKIVCYETCNDTDAKIDNNAKHNGHLPSSAILRLRK